MLAGALTQEDEDAVLAELEAITQVGSGGNAPARPAGGALVFTWVLIRSSQGDVELPDVPAEQLPEAPERKGGQRFSEKLFWELPVGTSWKVFGSGREQNQQMDFMEKNSPTFRRSENEIWAKSAIPKKSTGPKSQKKFENPLRI